MSTDEYAWTDEQARKFTAPCVDRWQWDAWLAAHDARVRRDAAREALDGLMYRFELEQGHAAAHHRGLDAQRAKLARMTTETYRDTRYPEETP